MLTLVFLTSLLSRALITDDRAFLSAGRNVLTFGEVERIARNHAIGEYRGGELRLHQFVPLGGRNYLGLDEQQRLVQVVELSDRVVAFPLAGERRIKEFFPMERGPLVALDEAGELFTFDRALWAKSPLREIIIAQSLNYAGSVAVLAAATAVLTHFGPLELTTSEATQAFVTTAAASAAIPVFRTLQIFSERNERPDGLRSLARRLDGFTYATNDAGRDVTLHGREETLSLRRLLAETGADQAASELFDSSCEDGLARGVPYPAPTPEDFI